MKAYTVDGRRKPWYTQVVPSGPVYEYMKPTISPFPKWDKQQNGSKKGKRTAMFGFRIMRWRR